MLNIEIQNSVRVKFVKLHSDSKPEIIPPSSSKSTNNSKLIPFSDDALNRPLAREKHDLSAPLPVLCRGGGSGGCVLQVDLSRRWRPLLADAGLGGDLRIASQVQSEFERDHVFCNV